MSKTYNLFIHVGAPRTGTSFLRSEVFPRIRNIEFSNKQLSTNHTTTYFDELSHYGDGDELSIAINRLNEPYVDVTKSKILVSEEHLLWSVYHMFGNVGSRALILKRRFPDAKIIITIRRQPEFLLSTYTYIGSLKREKVRSHLKDPWLFVNYAPEIESVKFKKKFGITVGLEWDEFQSTYNIGKNYFNRRARHFVAADFSWLSLYKIYADLFGDKSILVLPQEIWGSKPTEGVRLLEKFVGETIDSDKINFGVRVNASDKKSVRNDSYATEFINFIQSLTWQDNKVLDHLLSYCDLSALGYTKEMVVEKRRFSIGFGNSRETCDDDLQKAFEIFRQRSAREGILTIVLEFAQILLIKLIRSVRFRQRFYRIRRAVADRLRGLDFERIESLEKLSLDPKISEQYEGSKIGELKELFGKITLPERVWFLDLGCGKGRVICYVSSLKGVEVSRGVEISDRLCRIATKNISILGCENCEIINSDVRDLSQNIIDQTNVFYFYNPFPRSVLACVLDQILESVKNRESGFIIIYFNPVYADAIEDTFHGRFHRIDHNNQISSAITSVYWIN